MNQENVLMQKRTFPSYGLFVFILYSKLSKEVATIIFPHKLKIYSISEK